jgi:NADPH:quinone reductase-like Zn-dependent oxidoreductase
MTAKETMRAIVQESFGEAEVLELGEIPIPVIGDDEVLVKVHAAGLDRGTWHAMAGKPYLMRLAGFGMKTPKKPVPGLDLAGTVVAVGSDVTRFAEGDEVFGVGKGSFAEYAASLETKLVRKPADLSFEEAAVVAISGLTAIQGVIDVGKVKAGQKVLVVGASGGVGTYAVQVAKACGAEVTGVCSGAKADLVRSIGADHVIDYRAEDFAAGGVRYDLIVDIAGNSTLSRLRSALAERGTLVIVGGEGGGNLIGGVDRQMRAVLMSPFVKQRLTMLVSKETYIDLERLVELIEAGDLSPVVDESFPLEQAADAMARMVAGEARGKIAITV